MAIVGGPDVNRLAGLDIRAKRDELAVSIEAVTPRAPSGKDAAGDEAAEVAHHQRREFGRVARSARRRSVGVDIDAPRLSDAIFEIIPVGAVRTCIFMGKSWSGLLDLGCSHI